MLSMVCIVESNILDNDQNLGRTILWRKHREQLHDKTKETAFRSPEGQFVGRNERERER